MEHRDIIVIGGGPAGAATAIRAARAGVSVTVFEKGDRGRDKVCGDGLTPRAVTALHDLGVDLDDAHRIDGLRMIAGRTRRELPWPDSGRFAPNGAVWPRRRLDERLITLAEDAGAEVVFGTEALPTIDDDGRVSGVEAAGTRWAADLVVIATGAPGAVARMLGAERDPNEPFGLAIRTYAASPRHADRHLEACLTLKDEHGTAVPGYGWMFPAGDGTVNIGVGALSTMKGFKKLNLNHLQESYRSLVSDEWDLGPDLERPRAWRLPMSALKRHGEGWVAIGDAAGLVAAGARCDDHRGRSLTTAPGVAPTTRSRAAITVPTGIALAQKRSFRGLRTSGQTGRTASPRDQPGFQRIATLRRT